MSTAAHWSGRYRTTHIIVTLIALLLLSRELLADPLQELLGIGDQKEPEPVGQVISANTSPASDARMQRRLQQIYAEIPNLVPVHVAVSGGIVTLDGEVTSVEAREQALRFARQIEGVVEVQNNLQLRRQLSVRMAATWQELQLAAQRLLAALPLFLLGILTLLIFWFTGRWLGSRQRWYLRNRANAFIAGLLGQIVHLLFIVMGVVLALVLMDARAMIGTILGAAGLIGLAMGFAVRDTVENYIATILLSIRNPFEVNDLVNIENFEGNVARLTSRATILISPDGNHIRIPNATVFKSVITNYTRHPERRFEFDVGIGTTQDIVAAQALALQSLLGMPGVLGQPQPLVLVQLLGDSNVVLRIYAWVNQDQFSFAKVRSEAIRLVKVAFDNADVVMPEPMYRVRLSDPESDGEVPVHDIVPSTRSANAELATARDMSADKTIEDKVKSEVADGENLLAEGAPKEL